MPTLEELDARLTARAEAEEEAKDAAAIGAKPVFGLGNGAPKEYVVGSPNIAPAHDYLLVKSVNTEKTEGGIVLPEVMRGRKMFRIVEVGPGVTTAQGTLIPVPFKVGQYVMLNGNAIGFSVDKDNALIRSGDVIGVWRDGPRDS